MTKIKKILRIKNLAVFKDFEWDTSVKKKDGSVEFFKEINIIYGRNYSGKTTLSRIIRSLETHNISDKYDNPEFEITFDDGTSINQTQLNDGTYEIRVFNEDFVRDNLAFLMDTNKDGEIKSFAILGEDNARLQSDIDALKAELGSNEEGNESGLYKDLKEKRDCFKTADDNYKTTQNSLDKKLSDKATGNREIAIKYKPELFGDQNYNKTKLENDIQTVSFGYTPINDTQKGELQALLNEKTKDTISSISEIKIDIPAISIKVKELVEQKVGDSQKINELVLDAELNRWVNEGRNNHKNRNLKVCAFCGNPISNERWAELDKHFDEESEKLEKEIDDVLKKLTNYIQMLYIGLGIIKDQFYSKFVSELCQIENDYDAVKNIALDSINKLITQLKVRKNNLFIPQKYEDVFDFSIDLSNIYKRYHKVEQESNNYSNELASEQIEAKSQLRLDEVYRYIQEINYFSEKDRINELKTIRDTKETEVNTCEVKINTKLNEIKTKLSLMNDEEKGAIKVGEYLKEYFGHNYLTLQAKAETTTAENSFKFEVLRNGQPAYNLSEGECSLIAFCYFMAKLEDISTHDKKPIIWIDDPISSLDSNHVFFVYSLIATKIADTDSFSQLFVSTHNLDFLGYLKRMNGKFVDGDRPKTKQYFCINRSFDESSISMMPHYLRNHITEFNYLFREIYTCSKTSIVDNTTFHSFYNFGNNARKFLEIYLFYKYPDETEERLKMEKFFGEGRIPVIFSERINNEYSHLKENVSRGFSTVDVPEMQQVAKLIVDAIKNNDSEQYKALLNSIGVVEST